MANVNCICGSWTVRNANFCWRCGNELGDPGHTFESSYGNGNDNHHQPPTNGQAKTSRETVIERMATAGMLLLGAVVGVVVDGWNSAWIPLLPIGYLCFPYVKDFAFGLAGKFPHEFSKDTTTTLKIEHHETNDAGKRFVGLYDLPDTIQLEHLQHIAKLCLSPPTGEGRQFSRLKVCRPGKLSQGQFYTLRDTWLETHHVFYRDANSPNRGLVLTERCTRLLKKSVRLMVVDG